jgi:ubiquinone/menaquinone biosynthesis C-methylase UbiE
MAPDHPIWVDFARSMAPLTIAPAQAIAGLVNADAGAPCKVLDIAAGHGMFGITIGKRNPNAQVYAVDWRAVLEVAKEHAAAAGLGDRFHTIPGSAFEVELGTGYDVALLTNFLHHFSPATNQALLRRVHAALKPGGRAITLEFVPNADRISPPGPATFSLIMLATTESGDAYTFPELERMCDNAGFSRSEKHELPGGFESLVVSYK